MARSQPSAAREQVRDIVPGLIDLSERVLFGEVWERPGLSKRDRSLIVCATLIALGREKQLAGRPSPAGARQWPHQERARRGHHSPRFLCGLAGGDDCRTRGQGRVREELAAGGVKGDQKHNHQIIRHSRGSVWRKLAAEHERGCIGVVAYFETHPRGCSSA